MDISEVDKDFKFCSCGLPLGHIQKCLSFKVDKKREKIGDWSGPTKRMKGAYERF